MLSTDLWLFYKKFPNTLKGRYPTKKDAVEPMLLHSLSSQLKVSSFLFEPIYLENRTAKRFRQKIREFLGFRIATLSDAQTEYEDIIGKFPV